MSMMKPEESRELRTCARCGKPCDEECEVWRHVVCGPCFTAWTTEAPNAAEAERMATAEERAAASGSLSPSATWERWTKAWIARGA